MDSTALYTRFRSEMRDEVAPYLWSDLDVYTAMDDAQKMFCRLQGGIQDSTSSITSIAVTAGDTHVSVSPLILKLRYAYRASDGITLDILNFEDLQYRRSPSDYGVVSPMRLDSRTGALTGVVVGMDKNKLRLINIPVENETINLIVYRLPLETIDGADQDLEIDEQHHLHLLIWMKHLAHLKQDAETYDRGRSDLFKANFEAYCEQARLEREKREHKYRAVAYGGY